MTFPHTFPVAMKLVWLVFLGEGTFYNENVNGLLYEFYIEASLDALSQRFLKSLGIVDGIFH